MLEQTTQVIIAGAGPTGLMLANQLERFGIDYILIDKKSRVVPESRAMTVHARTLEFLHQLGLHERFLAQGKPATHAQLYGGNKHLGRIDFGPKYKGVQTPYPYVLDIEQNKTEQILLNNLERQDSLWFETELQRSGQDATGAWVEVTNGDGRHRIRGEYLVGCDGAHSLVRKQSGLEFAGKRYDTLFLVMDIYGSMTPDLDGILVCLRNGTMALGFSLLEKNKFRTFITLPDDRRYAEDPETAVALTRPEFPEGLRVENVEWFSYYKVACKMLKVFRKDRIFFAGDAAHVHSPAGGQGMNTGIGDAVNLGWKLAYTLNFPEMYPAEHDLLATYSPERTRFAKGLLNTTDKVFSAIVSPGLGSRILITLVPVLFGLISRISALQTLFFSRLSQLTINHRESSLSRGAAGKLKAGDRLPYFRFEDETGRLTDSLTVMTTPGYRVFHFGDNPGETTRPLTIVRERAVRKRYRLPAECSCLVRPDMYIQEIRTL